MKNTILASLATIPFALGTVFAGSASAIEGRFQFNGTSLFQESEVEEIKIEDLMAKVMSGEITLAEALLIAQENGKEVNKITKLEDTTATLSSTGITFSPNSAISIPEASQEGDFVGFNFAKIKGDINFNENPPTINPFLDFGSGDQYTSNPTIKDNEDVFNLFKADYSIEQEGKDLVAIKVILDGEFVFNNETAAGKGILTLQYSGEGATDEFVKDLINSGESLSGLTLSGSMFTASTPEPTVLFGLGVVATGLVATRRKKVSK